MTERLVEWDGLDLRISGTKLRDVAAAMMARGGAHIEDLAFRFRPGELTVSGKVKKGIPLPFRVVIRNIEALGRTVRVRLEEMAALGVIPIPSIFTRLIGNRQAADGVVYEAKSNSLVIQLDRFLPTFLDVELAEIRILEGGLAVRLARGGADLPPLP
jgi:hypothetical protein